MTDMYPSEFTNALVYTDFFPLVTSKMADSDVFENRILMRIIPHRLYRFPLYVVVHYNIISLCCIRKRARAYTRFYSIFFRVEHLPSGGAR